MQRSNLSTINCLRAGPRSSAYFIDAIRALSYCPLQSGMRKGVQIDSAGEIEPGRRLLWSEALRAGGMAVLWLSLGILLGYFLMLITSSLKLLSVFAGVVAAMQDGLVAWLHWEEIVGYYGPGNPIPGLGYPMRIGMLLVSGIAAGLVAWLLRRTVIVTVATATAHAEIVRLFGEHVSPGVVAELLARPNGDWSEVRPSAIAANSLSSGMSSIWRFEWSRRTKRSARV